MFYKLHESMYGLMVAVADENLIGKTLKHGGISFFINPRFYQGVQAGKEKVIQILKKAVNINLVGKEAVQAGKDAGMVDDENIIMIGKVPHAQAVAMVL